MLLSSFVLLLLIPAIFQGEFSSLLNRLLFTLLLIASLYLVAYRRNDLLIGVVLALPVVVTNWAPVWFTDERSQLIAYSFFQALFLSYIITKIAQHLFRAVRIDAEIIYAAICLYLLMGMTWALAYIGLVYFDPGAINLKVDAAIVDRQSASAVMHELIYFSYVTQTTLGYGDLTPASGIARTLVMIQALAGQIYVAVIIARLVGLQISSPGADTLQE